MTRIFTGTRQGGGSSCGGGRGGVLGGMRSGTCGSSSGLDKSNFYKLSPKARMQKMMFAKNEQRIEAQIAQMMTGGESDKSVQQFAEIQKQKRLAKQKKQEGNA